MTGTTRRTTRFRDYLLGGMAVLLVLLLGAFSLAKSITTRQREQAILALKKPEALDRYEQLALQTKPQPVPAKQPESIKEDAPSTNINEWASKDKLARWEHLLARWERFVADKGEGSWVKTMSSFGSDIKPYEVSKLGKSPRELSPEEWARIDALMAREQDLVREILDVAQLGGPVCALDLSTWPPYFNHHIPLGQMCGFLVWDANVKARAGDFQGAVERLLGGMKLGNALLEEPLLWSQYMRTAAVYRQVEWGLREGIEPGQMPPALLRRILDELGSADMHKAFAAAYRGECVVRLRDLASRHDGRNRADGIRDMDGGALDVSEDLEKRLVLWMYASPAGKPWFDLDRAAFADTMENLANASEGPYYLALPVLASIKEKYSSPSITHLFSPYLMRGFEESLQFQAQREVMLDLTRMGMLIEEYEVRHGACPQALEDIAPDLGGTVPVDPFSGQGYRYVVGGDGFLLYSVGKNLRDDGGTPSWDKGDVVWRGDR